MSEQTEEMVEEALAEAARSGLVRAATNDEYVFHHALVQQAVYLDLPSQRRKRLHRTAGDSLERLGIGVAAELARHFAEGEDHERTLTYSLLAGDQAEEVYAHGEAERHYRAALALLDSEPARDSGVRAVRLEATEKLGRVLALTGRYGEAMRLLECAATAYEGARDLEGAARVTATIGLVHARMGSPLEGVSRIDSLLERWEETMAPRDRAPLLCELARVYMFSGRYAEQLDATERAIDLARVAGDDYTLVEAQVRRGAALYFAGRIQEGIQAGEEGIPLAEAVGHLEALFHALGNVGEDYIETGDLTRGQERLERAVALMERLGDPGELSHSLCQLSRVHFLRGAWDQARVLVERAALLAPAEQSTWYAAYPLLARGELHAARGDVEAATRCLEDSAAIARQSDDLQALSRVQATLAELDLFAGHAEEAVSRLEPLLDLPACAGPLRLLLLPVLARARADLGDLERASQFAEVAVRLARWHGLWLGLLDALRVRGAVAALEGRTEEVDSAFTEASVLAADIGCPYQEARVLYDWAVAHSRSGLSEVAESRLGQALAIFRRLGAHLDAERTEQILASL
jgi:tetratricopeptide (TPR) repeat protein